MTDWLLLDCRHIPRDPHPHPKLWRVVFSQVYSRVRVLDNNNRDICTEFELANHWLSVAYLSTNSPHSVSCCIICCLGLFLLHLSVDAASLMESQESSTGLISICCHIVI